MSQTEVLFYHLERTTLETVLPGLLEKTLERDWKALVVCGDPQRIEVLDTHLWTYRDESFLPHAIIAASASPIDEPVLLTGAHEAEIANVPNKANVLFLVDGARAALMDMENYDRCVMIFDGRDDAALSSARDFWKETKSVGAPFELTYWQQGEQGRWEKRA